ncbi:Hypothetical protein R9X50_00578700 [Acrodontium crateriforme]|uniref:3-hydroxyacyl-CoA dehydrogenase n=1 Tax=Acrodontium crateriforme TaxID=150365 RepID=A0AAQ3M8F5_9PEZI|nr:Hypothetical protein R9X50_00578700 [Acrodontium crateriforme]
MSFQLPSIANRPVTVLGGGVLGRRIATVWVSGGYTVHLRDPSEKQRSEAQKYLDENVDFYAQTTRKTPGTLKVFEDLKPSIENAWLVIECVPEKLEIKQTTFADLEKFAPKDAILCSNSSSYKTSEMIPELEEATKERVANMHYMMPPQARVVELMTSGTTRAEIFPFLVEHLEIAGMHPYVALRESSGFIFNRIWAAIKREVLSVISEGVATPKTIDNLWKEQYGSPVGPCQIMDAVGLDTVALIEDHYIKERGLSSQHTVDFLRREFISKGKLGNKSSKGGLFPAVSGAPEADKETSVNPPGPTLYYLDVGAFALSDPLNSGRIIKASADGKTSQVLVSGQAMPDGLDIANGRIYWTNMGIPSKNDGSVLSCAIDGSDIQTVVPKGGVHTPKQLIVDEENSKLYFCDREGLRVMRCNLDGSALEVLIRTGDFNDTKAQSDQKNWCVGIAIDRTSGHFYWTQKGPSKGNQGRIFRANIITPPQTNASTRTDIELVFENLPEPIDLEIDPTAGHLYWTDRGELPFGNSINRVALKDIQTGQASEHKHDILVRNMHEAIGLKLDTKNGHLYATDLGGTVYRFDLDGKNRVKMHEDEGAFTGITLSA